MFVMMNAARLEVGVQGVAVAEAAFQQALAYAQERRQGRPAWGTDGAIFGHPDVRRMLALSKARIEAARSICLYAAVMADRARHAPDAEARSAARARHELLTPIAKAWATDMGVDVASTALQVQGGMGYVEETGAAQFYRDARIAPIYEGANGVQALDLVGRKLAQDGAAMRALIADMRVDAERLSQSDGLAEAGARLTAAIGALETATDWLLAQGGVDLLMAARGNDDPWLAGKGPLARLYASQILTLAPGLAEAVCAGAGDLAATDVAALSAE
jgi:hypothetical protein